MSAQQYYNQPTQHGGYPPQGGYQGGYQQQGGYYPQQPQPV